MRACTSTSRTVGAIGNTEHGNIHGQGRRRRWLACARTTAACCEPRRSPMGGGDALVLWRHRAPVGPEDQGPQALQHGPISASPSSRKVEPTMPRSVKKGLRRQWFRRRLPSRRMIQPEQARRAAVYSRRSTILPDMSSGRSGPNGRKFIPVYVTEQMVCHTLRRFCRRARSTATPASGRHVMQARAYVRGLSMSPRRCASSPTRSRKSVEAAVAMLDSAEEGSGSDL